RRRMGRGRRALGRVLVGADVGGERGYGGAGVVTLESERLAGGGAEVLRDEVEVGVEARRRGGEAGAVLAARDLPAGEGRPHSVEGEVPALMTEQRHSARYLTWRRMSHNPEVAGSNPAPAIPQRPAKCGPFFRPW